MSRTAFAFFLLVCCLVAPLIAAPLADIQRTPLEDNEVVEIRQIKEDASEMSRKMLLPLEDLEDALVERNGRQLEIAAEENRLLGGLLGTVLAFPGTLAAGVEGLLNGVVSGLLGGPRIADDESEVGAKEIVEEADNASSEVEEDNHVRQARGSFITSLISGIFQLKWYLAQSAWAKAKSLFG